MRQSMSRKRLTKRRSRGRANERRHLTPLTRRVGNRRKDDCQRLARGIASSHTPVALEGVLVKNLMRSAHGTARKPGVGGVVEARAEPVDARDGLVAVSTQSGDCLRYGANVLPRYAGGRRGGNVFGARIRGQAVAVAEFVCLVRGHSVNTASSAKRRAELWSSERGARQVGAVERLGAGPPGR